MFSRFHKILLGIALLGMLGALAMHFMMPTPTVEVFEKASTGTPHLGGAFTLINQNGEAISDTVFRGKFMLVFFGFTNCPDVCPAAMATITTALNQLSPEQQKTFAPIFISVDPANDTPPVLLDYLGAFHPSFTGLTGDSDAIKAATDAYRVYAAKSEDNPQHVDHTALVYMMDKNGAFVKFFDDKVSADAMSLALKSLVE
jgi:cytochrome oxidase Cu insertion factor (SCO1/SenC/PrrC family)